MRKYVFEEIYEELQMQIRNGTYQSGMPLPSESELGTHYECGRETIRRSLRLLEKDGLIIRKKGKVAHVAERQVFAVPVCELKQLSEWQMTHNAALTSKLCLVEEGQIPVDLMHILKLDRASLPTIHIGVLKLLNNRPMALEEHFVMPKYAPKLSDLVDATSIERFYCRFGIQTSHAVRHIVLGVATAAQAEVLKIAPGSAVFIQQAVLFDRCSAIIQVQKTIYVGDACRFVEVAKP